MPLDVLSDSEAVVSTGSFASTELLQFVGAIDQLMRTDPAEVSDLESIAELERQLARFECFVTKAVASFVTKGDWAVDGAKTPAAWLLTRCHLPEVAARRQVRRGRAMDQLPLCAEAWSEGSIGGAHIDALAKVRTEMTGEALARDEALLVSHAKEMKFTPFCAVLAYWEQLADPDGAEESDMARQARRDVYLAPTVNGMFLGGMNLDPVTGVIVSDELKRLERELFEADWAKARDELGREPKVSELCRTPAQRRADALKEMAIRSKAMPSDARRPEPLFSILVGYETIHGRICQLSGGHVLSPGSLLEWMDSAWFERIVFSPGKRIECSPQSRFFTGATRRAVEVRDQACTHEFCDVPAEDCQIDHIVPWAQGGPTTQENAQALCGFHNRLRNQRPPPGDQLPFPDD